MALEYLLLVIGELNMMCMCVQDEIPDHDCLHVHILP